MCEPGTTTCAAIDHVQVSTATSGLRIVGSALSAAGITLTSEADPAASGNTLAECYQLPQGTAWGAVATADIQIGGETASSVPVQILTNYVTTPSCRANAQTVLLDSPETLGANGVIGLGVFAQDCSGSTCGTQYYTCPSNDNCTVVSAAPPAASQVTNPATMFATVADRNGVIIQVPAVPANGAPSPFTGAQLVFGIGSESNNAFTATTVLAADPTTGAVTTTYTPQGTTTPVQYTSWFDTGSYAYFFNDTGIPTCPSSTEYCPTATLALQATVTGAGSNGTATLSFSVANASDLSTANTAFNTLAAQVPPNFGANAFVWGLPFFYGQNVYIGFNGATAPGTGGATLTGPFYAF